MHNFLLRYYVAEAGLDPDKDIQIRVLPPPEMVANLRAENVDGYLSPDPFNQRAVYDGIGFIYKLTRRSGRAIRAALSPPARGSSTRTRTPSSRSSNRSSMPQPIRRTRPTAMEIAAAISPKNYLNQPTTVVEQVLTGRYADGLGKVRNEPDRIDFDPFPWHSMAVWILTQMKRWGYVKGDIDYDGHRRAGVSRNRRRRGHERRWARRRLPRPQELHDHGQDLRPEETRANTSTRFAIKRT